MTKKMPKDRYLVLKKLNATGAALPSCEFGMVARKFIGSGTSAEAQTEWAEAVLQTLVKDRMVVQKAPISDNGPGFEITPEGRAALDGDPITIKKQNLSSAMVARMCQTALLQESGIPHETTYDRGTYKSLEDRGLVHVERRDEGVQIVRLTEDGKDICEHMMDRLLIFPPEAATETELEM